MINRGKGGVLKGLDDLDDNMQTSLQDILLDLQDGDKNLELKTEIVDPKSLAVLKVFGSVLKSEGLKESSELVALFIDVYLRNMISYQRKSRIEIIRAIEGLLEKETVRMTISDRLTSNMKK